MWSTSCDALPTLSRCIRLLPLQLCCSVCVCVSEKKPKKNAKNNKRNQDRESKCHAAGSRLRMVRLSKWNKETQYETPRIWDCDRNVVVQDDDDEAYETESNNIYYLDLTDVGQCDGGHGAWIRISLFCALYFGSALCSRRFRFQMITPTHRIRSQAKSKSKSISHYFQSHTETSEFAKSLHLCHFRSWFGTINPTSYRKWKQSNLISIKYEVSNNSANRWRRRVTCWVIWDFVF